MILIRFLQKKFRGKIGVNFIYFFFFKEIRNIDISQHANFWEFLTIMVLTIICTHCIAQCVILSMLVRRKNIKFGVSKELAQPLYTVCDL